MRYLNPGYAESFTNTTNLETVTNPTYNPYTGVAFHSTSSTMKTFIKTGIIGNDVECQFDIYTSGAFGNGFKMGFVHASYNTAANITGFWAGTSIGLCYPTNKKVSLAPLPTKNVVHHVWFNIYIRDESYGSFDLTIDDEDYFETFTPDSHFPDTDNLGFAVFFDAYCSNAYISNLIITDEGRIDPREKVFPLPVSAVTTDMTESNGIYIADDVGQTLLQTPDVEDLILNYGANSQVTGIGVLCKDAYITGTGMSQLIGVHKKGNTVTEHDAFTLTTTAQKIFNGWDMTNTKITDLRNMQFGLKAGV